MNHVDLFKRLVKIDSPSGKEGRIKKYINDYCLKRGIKLKLDKCGNLYFSNKDSKILLTAHMDTVQGNTHVKPIIFKQKIISNRKTILAADDKANLSSILMIVDYYFKHELKPDFELLFTVSEELGMRGSRKIKRKLFHSKYALSFDKYNEPFGYIVSSAPYGYNIIVEVYGKSSHASLPENGINALKIAAEFISQIPLGGKNNQTTFNFGIIEGGISTNTIPDKVILKGDIRGHSKEKIESIIALTKKILDDVTNKFRGTSRIKIQRVISDYKVNKKSDLIQVLKNILNDFGVKPKFVKTSEGSDISILSEKGFDCVLISSGGMYNHTKMEEIRIDYLKLIYKTTLCLLKVL